MTSTKNIFLINYVTLFLILAVIVALAVYLPRRFKKLFAVKPAKKARCLGLTPPVLPLSQSKTAICSQGTGERQATGGNSQFRLLLVPHCPETGAEYYENDAQAAPDLEGIRERSESGLGPAGKYFMELTYLLEKRLYGRGQTDAGDIKRA